MIQSHARSSTSTSTSTKNSQNKTVCRNGRSAAVKVRNRFGGYSLMVAVLPVRNTVSFKIANRLATVAFSGFLIGCDASTTPRPEPSIAPTTESSVSFTQSEKNAMSDEPTVKVYLNPLMTLLAGKERQKGSPLTEAEVLAVRDSAVFVQMTKAQPRNSTNRATVRCRFTGWIPIAYGRSGKRFETRLSSRPRSGLRDHRILSCSCSVRRGGRCS